MPPTSTVPRPGSNSSTTPNFSPVTTNAPSSLLIISSVRTLDRTSLPLKLAFHSWGMERLRLGALSLCCRSSDRILLLAGPGLRTLDMQHRQSGIVVASQAVASVHSLPGGLGPFLTRSQRLLGRHPGSRQYPWLFPCAVRPSARPSV